MQPLLNDIVVGNIFAFLLIFMRFGTALMIMPGIGETFVSPQIRLMFALALSFVITPFLATQLPAMPQGAMPFVALMISEMVIGLFIGTIMRIMLSALDTAGAVISLQAGYANAMLFNPVTASQGSLIGALYSTLGVTLMLVADLHHPMLASVVDSYSLFPANSDIPDAGSMSEIIARTVSLSFQIGVQMAIPFLVVGILIQAGMGILGRLMPQIQIFFLALPVQIFLSLLVLLVAVSAGMMFWLEHYNDAVMQLFNR